MNLVAYALRRDPGGTGQGHNTTYVGPLTGGGDRGWRMGAEEAASGQIVAASLKASDQGSHGMSTESAAGNHLIAPTVTRKWAKGNGGPAGDETQNLLAHTLTAEGFDASEDGTGRGTPLASFGFGSYPLTGNGDVTEPVTTRHGQQGGGIASDEAVRRLTPTECERLQGLPDGWTYPAGASLADAPSWYELDPVERARICPLDLPPDGPRYAACGDAVTAPVGQWVGGRILAFGSDE